MTDDRDPDEADREDRPHRYRRRVGGGSNRTLWLVFGGAGCVAVLGCGGVIALVVFWVIPVVTTDFPAANAAAEQFLDLLQQNRVDDAYAATSPGFQSRQSREEFARYVKRFETFTRHTSRTTTGVRVVQNNGRKEAFIQMTLQAPNNAMTCTLELVEADGVWEVDKITIP
jgi:hypothetical protein